MFTRESIYRRIEKLAEKTPIEIKDVNVFYGKVKYLKPFVIATARIEEEDIVILVLKTREEIIGIGEGMLPNDKSKKDVLNDIVLIAKKLVGMRLDNAFSYYIRDIMEQGLYIKIPVSLAILDLIARANNKRFGELFGKVSKEKVFTDITIGIESIDETIKDVKKALDSGFQAIKLKVGKGGISEDLKRIEKVYSLLPEDAALRIDANQGWSLDDAKKVLKEIERRGLRIDIVEQPVPKNRIDWLGELTEISNIPIIADESARVSDDLSKLEGKVDGVNLKLWKAGDPIEVYYMGQKARRLGMIVMIGCAGETNIGITVDTYLASTIPVDFADLDSDLLKEDIVKAKITKIRNSFRILPDRSGLAIELSDLLLEKFTRVYP